jgi:hypothetical protein
VYFPLLAHKGLAEEIAQRNTQGLYNWRLKLAIREVYTDAQGPIAREIIDRWLAEQRDLAKRWLFKQRAEQRARLRATDWAARAHLYKNC